MSSAAVPPAAGPGAAGLGSAPWPSRSVHVEWGVAALEQAGAAGDGIVIVDVLSFSTLVALATERGAAVRALAPADIEGLGGPEAVARRFDAHVAGATRDDVHARVTLSPSSAARVQAGDRLVVPSLNGGMLTARAAAAAFTVVGCLRNAPAVGRFVASALRIGLVDRVTIVAAGEQWKADWAGAERTRFAIEDWLGAGAVAHECERQLGTDALSAEARLAADAYAVTAMSVASAATPPAPDGRVAPPNPMHANPLHANRMHERLADSVSGRELIGGGYGPDVELAAAVGVDAGVAWVRPDGFIEALPFALRPATEADHEFLFALKHSTMHDYLEATFGRSDDGAERDRFRPDLARTAVVSLAGVDVAMVESRVEPHGLYLANLQVAPAHQSAGLGAAIVGLLAAVAHAQARPLVLRVLKVNTRAQQFYERLGFVVTGTVEPQWTMALAPPAPVPATG